MFGIPDTSYQMIKEAISSFKEIDEAIIFGSRAMGNYKKGSDIDIALKGDLTDETILQLSVLLDQKLPLPYFFDIIDFNKIDNQDLKDHIKQYGKRL